MIVVHRLNGVPLFVNPDLILYLESMPDTVITFKGGEKLPVKEPVPDIQVQILNYKQSCNPRPPRPSSFEIVGPQD